MRNRYYILRHGNSVANKEGIILSDYKLGTTGYGLTEQGVEDVTVSTNQFIQNGDHPENIKIISSPFIRAKESAEVAAKLLNIQKITFSDCLVERSFGDLDNTSNENYNKVWEKDVEDPDHNEYGVESVHQVFSRAWKLVENLEKDNHGITYILVTHGDTAQIMECGFKNVRPKDHRSLKPVEQGELRLLN